MKLSPFTRAALGTLVWSENDEDGSDNPPPLLNDAPGTHYASGADVDTEQFDFDEAGLKEFAQDCDDFWDDVVNTGLDNLGPEDSYASDFIFTRNGHGCGFWDGDWPSPADKKLTKIAEAYGTVGLYRGDDGKLYFHN